MSKLNYDGPVLLVVMDGVGLSRNTEGNAVQKARTEFLSSAIQNHPSIALEASGEAVGILKGQMGNSEVGHNALGAGQIIKQGIAKIEDEFETGEIYKSKAWTGAVENVKNNSSTLHFSGIFSDGGVHSSIDHLKKLITEAVKAGVKKIRVHLVLDGRDVPPQSADKYINDFEEFASNLNADQGADIKIACGGGRMIFVADRYETDWTIVERGWNAMVYGKAQYYFKSAADAIKSFRDKDPSQQDQYIPDFVITSDGSNDPEKAVGLVKEGDSFIYIDFRADRAIEIAQAFTYEQFPYFDRGTVRNQRLDVYFAGMTEYNSDTHVPEHQLIEPINIKDSLHSVLGQHDVSQLAIAETCKFGHITYYFDGNSYEIFTNEEQIEVKSDTRPYNERPWMRAAEITDQLLDKLDEKDAAGRTKFKFVRVNFANGDMVGHFAELEPTIAAMEAIDIQLERLAKKIDELGGMMLITADHGNAEELLDPETHKPKTSHTTNLVPCVFYDNTENNKKYEINRPADAGLTNVASTLALLLGVDDYPKTWREPLIRIK